MEGGGRRDCTADGKRALCSVTRCIIHTFFLMSKGTLPSAAFFRGGGGVGVEGGRGWLWWGGVATSMPEFSITDTWNCKRVKA